MQTQGLQIAVMTVPRDPQYVHQTLASLFAADPLVHEAAAVKLLVGSCDAAYLDVYRHHRRFHILPLTEDEQREISQWPVHRKFCHNYHRCLTLDVPESGGLLLVEDDVVFRDGFLRKLMAAIDEMENNHGLYQYVLALYVPYKLRENPSLRRGQFYCSYYAPLFYGTQAVYYPHSVLRPLANLIRETGVDECREPGDMIVKRYGESINAIYGTVASLVQHIGVQSTGLGHFHTTPTFEEVFPV